MAASTTQTLEPIFDSNLGRDKFKLTFSWTSGTDGAGTTATSTDDGTFIGQDITSIIKGKILDMGKVIPGATTPTDAFDVVVNDEDSVDLFGGEFASCTSGSTTTAYPYDGTNYGTRLITGAITPQVTGAGNSKTGSIVLHIS